MAPIICLMLFCMVYSCQGTFWETTGDVYERFQKIPPLKENKEKLMKYFLDRQHVHMYRGRRYIPYYDVVFAFDSSFNISQRDFNLSLAAASGLVRRFEPDTRFASVTFGKKALINFNFAFARTATRKLRGITYLGGKKNMLGALRKIRNDLFLNRDYGVRTGSNKRVLFVTDGPPEKGLRDKKLQKLILAAFLLKTLGSEVFVVAVGERIPRIEELMLVPSSTDVHFYRLRDMMQFKQMVDSIPEHIFYRDLSTG